MPLSKARMRERKRLDRAGVKPMSNLNDTQAVQPSTNKLDSLRQLIKGIETKPIEPAIPIYDPTIHRAGDTVRMKSPYGKREVTVTIPQIDADGNPMPD